MWMNIFVSNVSQPELCGQQKHEESTSPSKVTTEGTRSLTHDIIGQPRKKKSNKETYRIMIKQKFQ